jgi:hypothetical protein
MADSPLRLGARAAGALGGVALRPVVQAATLAGRAERAARAAALERLSVATLAAVDAALASRVTEEALDRVLASALARRAVDAALEGPLVEAVARGLADHGVVERVLDDAVVEQAAALVLASDELWVVVEEIAHSPAVTEAITQQSLGFADEVAGGVRTRSRSADAWIEAKVRRALRRRQAAGSS